MSTGSPAPLKPGTRLRSTVCATEVMVIQAPDTPVALTCGGAPMVPLGAPEPAATGSGPAPDAGGGTQLGKRYADGSGRLELLCTRPGAGTLAADGVPLAIKSPRPLPASD
ncbi:MAG TPA: hypothetical protein VIN04_00440 [Myxococcota bacterium]